MRLRSFITALFALAILGMAGTAHAQAPTSYTLKIYLVGASTPMTTATLQASNFACGQTPKVSVSPTQVQVNATKIVIDDPAAPSTADCTYTDSGTGPLTALPFGTQSYNATLSATNSAGTSADSPVSNPFSHPGVVAAAPTGLRVSK